jgi:hypothetical protein
MTTVLAVIVFALLAIAIYALGVAAIRYSSTREDRRSAGASRKNFG